MSFTTSSTIRVNVFSLRMSIVAQMARSIQETLTGSGEKAPPVVNEPKKPNGEHPQISPEGLSMLKVPQIQEVLDLQTVHSVTVRSFKGIEKRDL